MEQVKQMEKTESDARLFGLSQNGISTARFKQVTIIHVDSTHIFGLLSFAPNLRASSAPHSWALFAMPFSSTWLLGPRLRCEYPRGPHKFQRELNYACAYALKCSNTSSVRFRRYPPPTLITSPTFCFSWRNDSRVSWRQRAPYKSLEELALNAAQVSPLPQARRLPHRSQIGLSIAAALDSDIKATSDFADAPKRQPQIVAQNGRGSSKHP